jgi:hypothetical protein
MQSYSTPFVVQEQSTALGEARGQLATEKVEECVVRVHTDQPHLPAQTQIFRLQSPPRHETTMQAGMQLKHGMRRLASGLAASAAQTKQHPRTLALQCHAVIQRPSEVVQPTSQWLGQKALEIFTGPAAPPPPTAAQPEVLKALEARLGPGVGSSHDEMVSGSPLLTTVWAAPCLLQCKVHEPAVPAIQLNDFCFVFPGTGSTC